MVKISKYAKYGEYAKTIEILSRLTKNKYKPTPVDKFDRPKQKGETRNTTGILKFFGFNRWEVKYLKGHNEVIPHEICHVIDSISSYKQTSLKKEFREIAESYKDGFIDYEKRKYRMLSYAPVRPPLQERRRMSEANHSLSKCGDIRAQIHIGPSQSVSHYFFVPRLDLYP